MAPKDQFELFLSAFKSYYLLKRGGYDLDKNQTFILDLARLFYRKVKARISPADYKEFFDQLADYKAGFCYITEMPAMIQQWFRTRNTTTGPQIPEDFTRWCLAMWTHADFLAAECESMDDRQRQLKKIGTIMASHDYHTNRPLFAGVQLHECFTRIRDWMRSRKIPDALVADVEADIDKARAALADGSWKDRKDDLVAGVAGTKDLVAKAQQGRIPPKRRKAVNLEATF